MTLIPSMPLSNGHSLPLFGLGTWTAMDADELRVAIRVALDSGYRLIDTAAIYKNEAIIGEVIEEYFKAGKLKREEVFVTTKLPFYAMAVEDVGPSIDKQMADLRLDYLDLFLVHCPCGMKPKADLKVAAGAFEHQNDLKHIDTWRVLEKYHREGKIRALGVSNFNAKQIESLYEQAEIKPTNLQVECHIYWPQTELHELCKKLGMTLTAYAPIGSPGRIAFRPDEAWPVGNPMEDSVVVALATKYGKTPAQILLRHLIQRKISVIPKSTNPARVVQNIELFDFELTDAEQKSLLDVKTRVRLFEFRFCAGNVHFPFEDVDLTKKGNEDEDL